MLLSNVEKLFKRLQPLVVPTVPGVYLDYGGSVWRLHEDGRWEDNTGDIQGSENNWLLVAVAPFYPVEMEQVYVGSN
jgi:hypothetical protein